MVKCSNCGLDVADNFDNCPNCGNVLNTSKIIEKDSITTKCSNCGFTVPENNSSCPNCGSQVINDNPVKTCPSCGNEVGDSAFCPSCGANLEDASSKSVCPNCGNEVGDSAFCPSCGAKLIEESLKSVCPNCGSDVGDSAFCPSCGTKLGAGEQITSFNSNVSNRSSEVENESHSLSDKVLNADDAFSNKLGKKLMKSKSVDMLFDKTASLKRKTSNAENDHEMAKFYSRNEPAFLEIYESINDSYLKKILLLEREKLGNVGGGAIGSAMSMIHIPTKDMSFDEAKQFYINIVNKIADEIDQLKHKGIFDEDEYYKQKFKESSIENLSTIPGLKAFKALRKK